MTFPTIAATASSVEADNVTAHTVTLPSGISAGDLLICFFVSDSNETVNWTAGFTEVKQDSDGYSTLAIAWKSASGSEASNMTVWTMTEEESAHACYRITSWNVTNSIAISTGANGSSVNPDPDNLSPGWGAEDILWIAVEGNDDDDIVSSYPSGFTGAQITRESSTGSGTVAIGVAASENATSSLNPGTFTIEASEQWNACTVAVCGRADVGNGEDQYVYTVHMT